MGRSPNTHPLGHLRPPFMIRLHPVCDISLYTLVSLRSFPLFSPLHSTFKVGVTPRHDSLTSHKASVPTPITRPFFVYRLHHIDSSIDPDLPPLNHLHDTRPPRRIALSILNPSTCLTLGLETLLPSMAQTKAPVVTPVSQPVNPSTHPSIPVCLCLSQRQHAITCHISSTRQSINPSS